MSNGMKDLRYAEERYTTMLACTWCGGHHMDIASPSMLGNPGCAITLAGDSLLGDRRSPEHSAAWLADYAVASVNQPAVRYEKNPWVVDVSEQGVSALNLTQRPYEALIMNTGIASQGIGSALLVDSALLMAPRQDAVVFQAAVGQFCGNCGSFHMPAGSCPFQFTAILHDTHEGLGVASLVPADGPALRYNSSVINIRQDDRLILTGDQTSLYSSEIGLGHSVALPYYGPTASVFARPGGGYLNSINALACVTCGSFHPGQSCPAAVSLSPFQIDTPKTLSDWLAPERVSFSEAVIPSWHLWPASLKHLSAEFGDYLATRVGKAVHDAVESHCVVEGDLIVQVAIIVQAETGAITQIGRISSN